VTISGPAGVHASTAGGKTVYTKPFLIYPVAAQDTTYIAILHPAAGSYTITTNPASAAIARVLQADGINPSVTAGSAIARAISGCPMSCDPSRVSEWCSWSAASGSFG